MPRRITTIIFDFGGVLTFPQDAGRAAEMARICGLDTDAFGAAYRRDRLELDRGSISPQVYWARILAAGGRPAENGVLDRLITLDAGSWIRVNPRTRDWAAELRGAGYRTPILSNMPPGILKVMRTDPSLAWLPQFTPALFSCEAGMVKPEPGFYALCLQRAGAAAEQCIFLDDSPDNARAAGSVGITSFVFRGEREAARDVTQADARIPVTSLLSGGPF
jgi:putative hydrolase of the HAD superfamily